MIARWFLPILASALSLTALSAEERSLLGVEVGSGLVWGSAGELVFDPGNNRKESDPISLLTWPVQPSFQLTLQAKATWTPWMTTTVSALGAWPLLTTTMTDEDWRAQTQSGFLVYGRSQSDSYLTNHWSVAVDHGFRWDDAALGVGGLYKITQWEAWHGTSRYEYSHGVTESQFSGLVLEYRQVWYIPYLWAGWTGTWDQWSVTPSVRLSPYTWCFDTDNHMFPRVTYLDNLRGGWYASAAVEISFPLLSGLTAGVRASFETARGAVGETYAVTPTSTSLGTNLSVLPSADAAGGWFQEAALSIFFRN